MKIQNHFHDTLEAFDYIVRNFDVAEAEAEETYVRKDGGKIRTEDVAALRTAGKGTGQILRLTEDGKAVVRTVRNMA